jgi:DNA modification methylase
MLRKGTAKDINYMGTKNILRFPNKIGNKLHPTEKNKDMLKVLIENSVDLNKESIVLDPFIRLWYNCLSLQRIGRRLYWN